MGNRLGSVTGLLTPRASDSRENTRNPSPGVSRFDGRTLPLEPGAAFLMPAILVRTQQDGRFDDLIDDERAAIVTALRQTTGRDGLFQWPPDGENRFRLVR